MSPSSPRENEPPVHVVVPGSIETPTGGFVYDRRMVEGLAERGRLGFVIELPDRFPFPDADALASAQRAIGRLPDGARVVVDGLALTPLRHILEQERRRLAFIALVHHPLADETGLGAEMRRTLFHAERRTLALVRHVVVTSRTTARRLADFAVPGERISVVRPGIDPPRRRSPLPAGRRPVRLLAVGSLVPRKGYDRLLSALAPLRDRPWRLDVAGPHRDRRHAARLRALTAGLGLAHRIRWLGAVATPALQRLYRRADLFVLASRHEGFGIVLGEAATYGLPVLAVRSGAVPEAASGIGALLIAPGDRRAFRQALERMVADARLRAALAARSRAGAARRPRWREAQRAFIAALDGAFTR